MTGLIGALILFVGSHFLLSHPLRKALVSRLGERGFLGLYSLVALVTFGIVLWQFRIAPATDPLWTGGEGLWIAATAIMFFASILLAGAMIGNPAMPMTGADKVAAARPTGVLGITRHPLMWSFAFWSLAHILVAPNQATIILCAGIAFLALTGSRNQDRKKQALMGDAWAGWEAKTSFVPLGKQLAGKAGWATAWPGLTLVLAGIAIWLLATYLHPIAGAPTAGIWLWIG